MIVTKEEDNLLSRASLRPAVVDAIEDGPLARYIKAEIPSEFMGIMEDPARPDQQQGNEVLGPFLIMLAKDTVSSH